MFGRLIFFIFLITNSAVYSQEREREGHDPVADTLSDKYEAGHYLMYDCSDKHWVCVMESYYQDCSAKRAQEIESKKINLSCAPIGYHVTKKACFQRQLYMVSQNFGTRFCLHPDWKQRELEITGR